LLWELRSDERGLYIIHLLLNCAAAAAAGRPNAASTTHEHIAWLIIHDSDAMQLVAAAFVEAMVHHALQVWSGLCRALLLLRATPIPIARWHFIDLCPFQRFAGAAMNLSLPRFFLIPALEMRLLGVAR